MIVPTFRVGMQPVTLCVTPQALRESGTQSVPGGVTTRSVGTSCAVIVPTLRVGMQPVTLCVTPQVLRESGTQSVPGGVTTQSVGTSCAGDRAHAPRGHAARDALRHTASLA